MERFNLSVFHQYKFTFIFFIFFTIELYCQGPIHTWADGLANTSLSIKEGRLFVLLVCHIEISQITMPPSHCRYHWKSLNEYGCIEMVSLCLDL
jgi:hypothetical protein